MSDDKMRKKLIRDGWNMASTSHNYNQHVCPMCSNYKEQAREQARIASNKTFQKGAHIDSMPVEINSAGTNLPTISENPKPAPLAALDSEPFLIEAWLHATDAERTVFLRYLQQQPKIAQIVADWNRPPPPPSLYHQWFDSPPGERARLLASLTMTEANMVFQRMWDDPASRKVFLADILQYNQLPLMRCWNCAADYQRELLLSHITKYILPNKTLEDHWKEASDAERDSILRRYAPIKPAEPKQENHQVILLSEHRGDLPKSPSELTRSPAPENLKFKRKKPKHKHAHPAQVDDNPTVSVHLDDDDAIAQLSARLKVRL
jgi:hypothetical protein